MKLVLNNAKLNLRREKMVNNKTPKVSVVMATHNRSEFVGEAILSILNQSYKNFEFIIIDDASTDDTALIVENFSQKDNRIKFFKNEDNLGLIKTLNKGFALASGKYIARMDDDDISMPMRFQKQVEYLDEHPNCSMVGSYVKAFPYGEWPLNISDSDELEVILNFYNCIPHPTAMIRKEFLDKHDLKYRDALYAEDYNLWKDIILNHGQIYNIPETLLKVRNHKNRVTLKRNTANIMSTNAAKIKEEMLSRFFNPNELIDIKKKIQNFPNVDSKTLIPIIERMKEFPNTLPLSGIKKFEERFVGIPSDINIFFSADNNYSQHVAVAITSILINSLPFENFNFYILDGGINDYNKKQILKCKQIKECNIEILSIDENMFEHISVTNEASYISQSTYYRYVIPLLKPQLKKCFYFDSDIIVRESLNKFWNTPFDENYIVAVEDLWNVTHKYYSDLGIKKSFNAGVYLINVPLWNKDDITTKLFKNTIYLAENNLLRWNDQDALNYTLNGKVKFISPKYNLQYSAFSETQHSLYTNEEMWEAKEKPIIIHYTGTLKPWNRKCPHPFSRFYFKMLKKSPYHSKYLSYSIERHIKKIFSFIFNKEKNFTTFGKKNKIKICGLTFVSTRTENYNFARGFYKEFNLLGINLMERKYKEYTYIIKILGCKCYSKVNYIHFFNDKFDYLWNILDHPDNKTM